MRFPFVRGARVRALRVVTESGDDSSPDRNAGRLDHNSNYVHAEIGELGTVVEDDDPMGDRTDPETGEIRQLNPIPTVRFDRTGTATIVREDEVELVEPTELLGCDRCGAFVDGKCRYHVEVAGPGHRCDEWYGR